jgi:hypothetical protein
MPAPNETEVDVWRRAVVVIAARILRHTDTHLADAVHLAELIEQLDAHLVRGGELPGAWQPAVVVTLD